MLGGMRALPDDGWSAKGDGAGGPEGARLLGVVSHVFTHFTMRLRVMDCSALALPDSQMPPGEWWPLDRIDEAGLPTLFARAARLALAAGEEKDA
jgi:A/G-specific adenine glycosylase